MQELDFINLDSELTSAQKDIRSVVRKIIDKEFMPVIRQHFHDETFPTKMIKIMGENGLLGGQLTGYGLAGLDPIEYGLCMQELERGDSGLRSFVSVQSALCMYPIYTFGSQLQKEKYLAQMGKGELIGCFGLTEPDFGSNPQGMRTRAVETKDGYVLNGNKMWITNGTIADVAIVWAKLNDKVQGFLVDKGTKGFTTSLMKGKYSLRASLTGELHFDNCIIPKENILPDAKGLRTALDCLNQARYGISWGVIGAAKAVFLEARDYSINRIVFDVPLASKQIPQMKLTKMVQEISKAELLCLHLGKLKIKGELKAHQVSLAKMNNVAMAIDCARNARDLLGANGITDEYCTIRHMLNLEAVNTYEGTEDIHRLIIGKEITGLSAI